MHHEGMPFSTTANGTIEYGTPLSSAETFALAAEKFTTAASDAAGDAAIINLAAVGRGRALLNAGQFAEAAQAVAAVPTAFVYVTNHGDSPLRVQNLMKGFIFDFDYLSVSDQEGTNGYNYATANDPRVVTNFAGPSRFDGETPHYQLLIYNNFAAPVKVATGVEARLIEAEAALHAGDATTWKAKLDAARAFFNMGPVTDPGTADARVDLMFRERAFSLFGTGHRLGDMRRTGEAVWPRRQHRLSDRQLPQGQSRPRRGSVVRDSDLGREQPELQLDGVRQDSALTRDVFSEPGREPLRRLPVL